MPPIFLLLCCCCSVRKLCWNSLSDQPSTHARTHARSHANTTTTLHLLNMRRLFKQQMQRPSPLLHVVGVRPVHQHLPSSLYRPHRAPNHMTSRVANLG
jgi:hypothetical protein